MEKFELEWLDRAAGTTTAVDKFEKVELKKQALLTKLKLERQNNLNVLREGAGLKVYNKKGDKKNLTDLKNRDQLKEFDWDDQTDGFTLANDEDALKHYKVRDVVSQQELLMSQATIKEERLNPKTGKVEEVDVPLFSQEEIAQQVYDPMVREGLMSETFVPDKYSRTQEMLDPVFKEYGERLKRDKKNPALQFLSENQGVLVSSLSMMMTVTTGSMDSKVVAGDKTAALTKWGPGALKDMKESLVGKDGIVNQLKQGDQIVKFLNQGLSLSVDVFKPAIEGIVDKVKGDGGDTDSPEKPDLHQLAPGLTMSLYVALCTGLSTQLQDAKVKVGLEAVGVFSRQVDKSGLATAVASNKLIEISPLIVKGLQSALNGLGLTPAESLTKDWPAVIAKAGEALGNSLNAALAKKELTQALDDLNADAAAKLLAEAGLAAGKAAVTDDLAKVLADDATAVAVKEEAVKQMTEEFESKGEGGDDNAHKKAGHTHEADWVRDPKTNEWVCSTCEMEKGDNLEVFSGMLERRIAEYKRNQGILDWGFKLVSAGVDVAANFIAPLAAIGSAVKMAKNLVEAGRRTRDLYNFMVKREGLLNAVSVYSSAVGNFIKEVRTQMLHYIANAAFEAAKIIGAALQCGGITAVAGFAVSTAASFAQALEAVIYEANKRMGLEKAWKTYRAYLVRKKNRRMGLEAINANPTLAKYALAWGAIVKKDPLVVDVLTVCDLTPETLKDPKANVDRVVTYLEARFGDSSVVTGRQGEFDVGDVTITSRAWMKLQLEAIKTEGLDEHGAGLIVASLTKWEQQSPAMRTGATEADPKPNATTPEDKQENEEKEKKRQKHREEATGLLEQLIRALEKYQPKMTKGGTCLAMVSTREAFLGEARRQLQLVTAWKPVA